MSKETRTESIAENMRQDIKDGFEKVKNFFTGGGNENEEPSNDAINTLPSGGKNELDKCLLNKAVVQDENVNIQQTVNNKGEWTSPEKIKSLPEPVLKELQSETVTEIKE